MHRIFFALLRLKDIRMSALCDDQKIQHTLHLSQVRAQFLMDKDRAELAEHERLTGRDAQGVYLKQAA